MRESKYLKNLLYFIRLGWPKLLVALSGLLLYTFSGYYFTAHQALLTGIAVNLISIPLIFLLYEIWNTLNKRKLNESVFEYAANEMSLLMAEVREQLEPLMLGIGYYCNNLPIVIDDSDTRLIKVQLLNSSTDEVEQYFDSGTLPEDTENDDFYSFNESDISSLLSDQLYIGYQIYSVDLSSALDKLERLIQNSFVMEKMSDKQSQVIVSLHQTLRALNGVLLQPENMFMKLLSHLQGFSVSIDERHASGMFIGSLSLELYENDETFSQVIDQKIFNNKNLQDLNSVYMIDRDHMLLFGDLLVAVINDLNAWRKEHSVFIDHANAKIGVL